MNYTSNLFVFKNLDFTILKNKKLDSTTTVALLKDSTTLPLFF